jgi:ferredoxin
MPKLDPSEIEGLEEVPGWEDEWEKHKDYIEPDVERKKRFGQVYEVEEEENRFEITMYLPSKIPVCEEKFRYGLPDEMPDYNVEVEYTSEGHHVRVYAEIPEPDDVNLAAPDEAYDRHDDTNRVPHPHLKKLAGRISSFPDRIEQIFELPEPVDFVDYQYRDHILEIRARKEEHEDDQVWSKFHIMPENCTGCFNCFRMCPTEAISGSPREIHDIDPELCINCGACGYACPFDAIKDQHGELYDFEKPNDRSKAKVVDELCTGCEFCVDVCPFDCIWMEDKEGEWHQPVAVVDEDSCTSCKLCEQVCIKEAIVIPRDLEDQGEDVGQSFRPMFEKEAWRDHGLIPPSELEQA